MTEGRIVATSRRILHFSLFTLILFLTACERRELTYDYHPFCEVTLEVDWSRFVETPTGMTAIFYNESGEAVATHTTHSVHRTKISLREGKYNIILFNQSPPEFGTIGFRGFERFAEADVYPQEKTTTKGWYTKADDEVVAVHPEPLGMATFEGFEVTEDMIEQQRAAAKAQAEGRASDRLATRATVILTPRNVIAKGKVTVHIKGIHNLRSVRGSISGMAGGFIPSTFCNSDSHVTHLLEEWRIARNEGDYTTGTITTAYSTFGMPSMQLTRGKTATRADDTVTDIENTFENAILTLELLLVDNKTVKKESFNVSDHINISEETGEIVLTLDIREEMQNPPILLPDVKPEGGSAGGFDATVDDWGEEEDIEIGV